MAQRKCLYCGQPFTFNGAQRGRWPTYCQKHRESRHRQAV